MQNNIGEGFMAHSVLTAYFQYFPNPKAIP